MSIFLTGPESAAVLSRTQRGYEFILKLMIILNAAKGSDYMK